MNNRQLIVWLAFILLTYLPGAWAQAQEVVTYSGIRQQSTHKNQPKNDPLALPFIDDFAYPGPYPDPMLWQDSGTYVNTGYAIDPPTIGVATFDALAANGELYPQAGYGQAYLADQLTSQPIDLNYSSDNTIYLSFFVQPQGKADSPERTDSLVLDFYSPQDQQWHRQWAMPGQSLTDFKVVILPVNNNKFLREGFRFRFQNYASLVKSINPDFASNADHWHIDYVYLNRFRTPNDTLFQDLALLDPPGSLLKEFEAMPWEHYAAAEASIPFRAEDNFRYRNLDPSDRLLDSLKFIVRNRMNNENKADTLFAGAFNVPANSIITYDGSLNYRFPPDKNDSALFDVTTRIVTDPFDRKANNSYTFQQQFYNYYAYDDGSAEGGYGLSGEGSKYGAVAYKFHTYQPDSIKAIQMLFNQTLNDYTSSIYFYLTIWDNDNGRPGEVLYRKTNYQPEFNDELNGFTTYRLQSYSDDFKDTAIFVTDTFYIGWTQTSESILNVGLDFNRNASDQLFYNLKGIWEPSSVDAALMVRPVFGALPGLVANQQETATKPLALQVYPNPAAQWCRVAVPRELIGADLRLFNASGQLMWQQQVSQDKVEVPTHRWPNGLYFIQVLHPQQRLTHKLLIQHD